MQSEEVPPLPTEAVEVLLTGFEPFAQHRVNPSWEVVKTLSGMTFGGRRTVSHLLPVEYGEVAMATSGAVAPRCHTSLTLLVQYCPPIQITCYKWRLTPT